MVCIYIYMRKSTRTHTHMYCMLWYVTALRFFDFTWAETGFCQRLGFLNIFWDIWSMAVWVWHLTTANSSIPWSTWLRASEPRWVSRSLWWKRRTPPSQRPQRSFSNGRESVFNNGFKRYTLSKIHFQNHDVGWQHLLLNTFERFLRAWNQEASWGGAGIKILLAVKYKRDPQGDEPGKERAAVGG